MSATAGDDDGGPVSEAATAGGTAPLTLGTAGHVDHGKTALVAALTGVETDRLPEEKARGLTIVLGYAPLRLPGGRRLSLVDVPGHERFVRTMVAGASGIDAFLMVVAADDGVMPQTREHAEVLRALGVERGVVAVTKADLADPARATAQVTELLPGCAAHACSTRTGEGIAELAAALEELASGLPSRASLPGPTRLHVDRVFTVPGRGTVLTGTLWSGRIGVGERLETRPSGQEVRVRGLEVHDEPVESAQAGQRVAVNVVGAKAGAIERGDVLCAVGAVRESRVLDCSLSLREGRHGERVQVHHGTRAVAGRLCALDDDLFQLRLEAPLLALAGDRVVVRRLSPPDTLGGGVVLEAQARRHGRHPHEIARLRELQRGEEVPAGREAAPGPSGRATRGPGGRAAREPGGRAAPEPSEPAASRRAPQAFADAGALAECERLLREAGPALLSEAQLDGHAEALRKLRRAGVAVRVSGRLYAHAEVVGEMRERIVALLEREGSATLAQVRDALGVSRKSAQAFLERLDVERTTGRLPDDRRVLRNASRETVV
jgi:selenocysteine-specific elongation factor